MPGKQTKESIVYRRRGSTADNQGSFAITSLAITHFNTKDNVISVANLILSMGVREYYHVTVEGIFVHVSVINILSFLHWE